MQIRMSTSGRIRRRSSNRAHCRQEQSAGRTGIVIFRFLRPELAHIDVETTMDFLRRFCVLLLAVFVLFGGRWWFDFQAAQRREHAWQQKRKQLEEIELAQSTEKARREYTLEILGLDITVEQYRQGNCGRCCKKEAPM